MFNATGPLNILTQLLEAVPGLVSEILGGGTLGGGEDDESSNDDSNGDSDGVPGEVGSLDIRFGDISDGASLSSLITMKTCADTTAQTRWIEHSTVIFNCPYEKSPAFFFSSFYRNKCIL